MSPEEELILRCVNSVITDEPLGEPPSLDWEQVFQLGEVNRLIPILSAILPEKSIPEEWIDRFERSARRRRMRAAVMIEEFQRILVEFTQADIRVIPIKGIAVSQQVYPSPSMRYFDDLDLLVEPQSGPDALNILKKIGYAEHPNAPHPDWHHLVPYIHRKRGTMIEIHVDLIRRSNERWNINGIWSRSRTAYLGDVSTLLLSSEDSLITSVLHARHNLYNRLSYFIDCALLARAMATDGQVTTRLSKLTREAGASSALGYVLSTASRLFGLEDMPGIDHGKVRYWPAKQIASWNSLDPKNATLRQGPLSKLMELFLMDSLRDSLSLAARLIAPPHSFIAENSNERVPLMRYANRLSRRIRHAIRQFGQLIQGK